MRIKKQFAEDCFFLLCVFLCVLCDSVVSSSLLADEPANLLFEQLRTNGVAMTEGTKATLPPPLMADGLDASGQQTVLEKVVGKRSTVRAFTAKLGTAPHVYS